MGQDEESIFAAAVELNDPAARSAYVDRACGGNAELRWSVEAILSAFAAGSYLKHKPADKELRRFRSEAAELLGVLDPPPRPRGPDALALPAAGDGTGGQAPRPVEAEVPQHFGAR